jgi:hypothetical protein
MYAFLATGNSDFDSSYPIFGQRAIVLVRQAFGFLLRYTANPIPIGFAFPARQHRLDLFSRSAHDMFFFRHF